MNIFLSSPENLQDEINRLTKRVQDLETELATAKPAPSELEDQIARYTALFNAVQDAIFVHAINPDGTLGKFVEVNKTACSWLGYTREELLQLSPHDIDAPEKKPVDSSLIQKLSSGLPVIFETVHLTKHGERIPVEINASGLTIAGKAMTLSVVRDISERKKNLGLMEERELKYRTLVEYQRDLIIKYNTDYVITYISPVATNIFGRAVTDIIGSSLFSLVSAADRDKLEISIHNSSDDQEGRVRELELQTVNGLRFFEFNDRIIRNPSGRIVEIISTARDISETKQAQQALQQSEKRFKNILQNISLNAVILDREANIHFVNNAFLDLVGYQRNEVIGKDWFELFALPESREQGRMRFQKAVLEQRILPVHESVIQTRDGVERRMRWSNTVMADFPENSNFTASLGEDITEKWRSEQENREARDQLQIVLQNVADAIMVVDHTHSIIFANKNARLIFPFFADGISVRGVQKLIDENMELADPDFNRIRVTDLPSLPHIAPTTFAMRRQGAREWNFYVLQSNVIWNDNGDLRYAVVIFSDITAIKNANEATLLLEKKLMEAQKLESLERLAGGVAHNFNNLLQAVIGYGELSMKHIGQDSPVHGYLKNVLESAERASQLSSQMLACSGVGPMRYTDVDLTRLVRGIRMVLKLQIHDNIILSEDLTEDLPQVKGDPVQIRQIINNLVQNAAESIGESEGLITITTGKRFYRRDQLDELVQGQDLPEAEYVYLEVSDTGSGIASDQLPKIFEPFFTTKFTGRGLGLTAVLGLVKGHHGAIWVHSSINSGTVVKILFPFENNQIKMMKPVHQAKTLGEVLVVDDEKTVLVILGKMLEQMGYFVHSAQSGREGIEMFRNLNKQLKVVLLDLKIPDISGDKIVQVMNVDNPDIPIIISTGFGDDEVRHLFDGKKIAGFLQKPYRIEALEKEFKRIFESEKIV